MIQETRRFNQEEKKKKLLEARMKTQLWASKELNKKRKQKPGKRLTESTYPEKT